MSARHTLLGLLAEGPAHGYGLGQRLSAKLGPAWEINSGQVSQTLARLEEEGLVRAVNDETASRSRKRNFELTEPGAVELNRWFDSETAGVRVMSPEFLAKVNLGGPERCEASLAHITDVETDCLEKLEKLTKHRDSIPLWPITAERLLKRCAVTLEILQVHAYLQGAGLTRETIAILKDDDALWDSSRAKADADDARRREKAREDIFRRMARRHLDEHSGE